MVQCKGLVEPVAVAGYTAVGEVNGVVGLPAVGSSERQSVPRSECYLAAPLGLEFLLQSFVWA